MNYCVPDWSMEDDLRPFHDLVPPSNQKKSVEEDNELVELLWRNGHVVMQSQYNRKHPPNLSESRPPQKHDLHIKPDVSLANPSNLIHEDETASWFQYALDDSLGKEFCSEFLSEPLMANAVDNNKPNKEIVDGAKDITMPPSKAHNAAAQLASGLVGGPVNFSHFARPMKNNGRLLKSGSRMVLAVGESSSIRTVGSSARGSNQIQNQADFSHTRGVMRRGVKDSDPMISLNEGPRTNTLDAAVTSSSGGSGCSFGRITGPQSTSNQNEKRRGRDLEESECRSEEAEYESVEANRPAKRPASTRKSRAAEVHNLSERRRRDRINEKMKALQELIPHCNKSDKASMLDEAIEYLKSLQLQLQLMWMGSGMAPVMFPAIQQYMPRVGIGMGHPSMPSINNPIQLSRAPLVNHALSSTPPTNQMPMCPAPAINRINFTTSMQNVHLPEPYARYFGFPQMQPPPQAMNLYANGSHMVQQNQASAGSSGLLTAAIPSENVQNGQSVDNRLVQNNHHRQSSLNPSAQ